MTKKQRIRVDSLLVQQGIAENTDKAMRLILAGRIFLQHDTYEARITSPALCLDPSVILLDKGKEKYVSRGGYKLETALDFFSISPKGKVCVDIGAATGGFTDCLLQRGAELVYAIDIGEHLLHEKLVKDPRVINKEKTSVTTLSQQDFPTPFSLVVGDISFISLKTLFPPLLPIISQKTTFVLLVKPQFELPPRCMRKGVVLDTSYHTQVLEDITQYVISLGLSYKGFIPSKIKGRKGNQEFLLYLETQ